MDENVIDATGRFGRENAEAKRARSPSKLEMAVEKLKKSSRVDKADQPTLAANLGRLAAQISPQDHNSGARRMFEAAGGEYMAKWPKRKRLVRYPDEAAEPSRDAGAYEANGPAYLALADAAASLLAQSHAPTDTELQRARRELLKGTTLLPEAAPLTASASAAQELIADWGKRLTARIATETRLVELMNVLRTAPFSTRLVLAESGAAGDPSPELIAAIRSEPAGEAALTASSIACPRWREGVQLRFVPASAMKSKRDSIEWARPILNIGTLMYKQTVRTFIFPDAINELILSDYRDHFCDLHNFLPNTFRDWLISIGSEQKSKGVIEYLMAHAKTDNEKSKILINTVEKLPETEWSEQIGYGWKSLEYFRPLKVLLELVEISAGEFEPKISVEEVWDYSEFVPNFGPHVEHILDLYSIQSQCDFTTWSMDYLDGVQFLAWPEWLQLEGRAPKAAGRLIGAIEPAPNSYQDWDDGEMTGWINNSTLSAAMATDEDWRFVPKFDDPPAPVPCGPDSIAASLLRNHAGAASGRRVADMLVAQANAIAQAGLGYHEAVVEHYRNALLKP